MKKQLITSALPYANGPLHFGHLSGAYLPADVFARHKKLQGNEVLHISGSDEHGVAIMQNAQKADCDYQTYVDGWHKNHAQLFKKYLVDFDFFGQTSAPYHKEEVLIWFKDLYSKGMIEPKEEDQLQCQDCHNYLPDRFVEGTCYECGHDKARGDECPQCGEWIDPIKLIDPVCKFCDSKKIEGKKVTQYYLMLSKYHQEFREWFQTKKDWRKTVLPYVDSLSKDELVNRAITRDLDWGIDVPALEGMGDVKDKKLYVWFDAPIGYVSNTKEFFKQSKRPDDYLKDWWKNDDVEITHFIGKDNIIFHTIIFPVMAMTSGRVNPPSDVPANQYLNLEGQQFSKSSGWYVDADKAVEEFGSDALRYYLISLIPEMTDSSFSWEQFMAKVNNELANNIGNFINRCMKFTAKNWPDGLEANYYQGFMDLEETKQMALELKELQNLLDQKLIKRALEKVMSIGALSNTFFSDRAPWAEFKEDPKKAAITLAFSSCYALIVGVILGPFLPHLSGKITSFYGDLLDDETRKKIYCGDLQAVQDLFQGGFKIIGDPQALVAKIDPKIIEEKLEELNQKRAK